MFIKVFVILLLYRILGCCSFNLDDRNPIIKVGPKGSLFGLSVAEHHVSSHPTTLDDIVILVGAPTADAQSFHGANSYKPGSLFKCGVTVLKDDCKPVIIDDPVVSLEINNSNQWLGMTLKRQKPGGKVAVCAPRFTLRGGGGVLGIMWEAELGRCYVLESNLQPAHFRHEWIPCMGKLNPGGSYSHEWYGYCQAGMSVDFANNKDEDLVFGMPGPFHWTGAINSNEMSQNVFFPISLWSKDDDRKGVVPQNSYLGTVHTARTKADQWFSGVTTTWIPEFPLRKYGDPVSQNSYLGFSVATGNITGKFTNFVAGAPRANDTGIVVVFEKEQQGVAKVLKKKEILFGERLASAFGYDVQIIDITGDGREDLIVGAPQYYDKDNKHGGAVYVYINKGQSTIGPTPTKVLYGPIDSAFGNSITNLGDINMDGTNDIAIGAPGFGEGTGAVYIYHGTSDPNAGIQSEPNQILLSKNLTSQGSVNFNFSGFGYSVNGGLDMDLNGYPDLLVGSLSDAVVLYRSRPIVNVHAALSASVKKIVITPEGNPHVLTYTNPTTGKTHQIVSYNITLCMNYTSTPTIFDESVSIQYTIKLDLSRQRHNLRPRVTFTPLDYMLGSKTGVLLLYPQSQKKSACSTMPVFLANDIQDKLSPIKMSATFDVIGKKLSTETSRSALPSLNGFPVMNLEIPNIALAQVNISKDCGPDEVCRSNLQMNAHYVVLLEDDLWHSLKKVVNGPPLLLLGTEKEIGLKINIANPGGEDAHQAKMEIFLPPFLHYIGLAETNATAATISCTTIPGNSSVVTCKLGNPFRTNSLLSVIVRLENDERLYSLSEFSTDIKILTSSIQPGIDATHQYKVMVRVQAQVNMEGYTTVDQIHFGGKVVGESAVNNPEDAGLFIGHTYEIQNTGTSEINDVYVNVSWPQLIHNGKWLFYLLGTEISGAGRKNVSTCAVPQQETNPLLLKSTFNRHSSTSKRLKRDLGPSLKTNSRDVQTNTKVSASEILKCSDLARCVYFTCHLGSLAPQETVFVKLQAVVWNSTFIEEYYGVAEIRVFSSATVAVNRGNILYSSSSVLTFQVSTSILSEQVVPPEQEVKWWIIAVSTLAGVILLVVIVLVLWRCGFFKRRRDFGDYHKAHRHKQASKKADEISDRMLY